MVYVRRSTIMNATSLAGERYATLSRAARSHASVLHRACGVRDYLRSSQKMRLTTAEMISPVVIGKKKEKPSRSM